MIPEIIGVTVPEKFLQNVPKVHKLTLEKDNEKFRAKGTKGERMDIDKAKKNRKKKNERSKEMVVDDSDPVEGDNEDKME